MKRTIKIKNGCQIEKTYSKGKITFKCKGIKRRPTEKEILNYLN